MGAPGRSHGVRAAVKSIPLDAPPASRQLEVFTQDHDATAVPDAEATLAVKQFRWFASFPLVERRTENGRTVLRYRDLRFRAALPGGAAREGLFVVAKVVFDENRKILASGLTGEER